MSRTIRLALGIIVIVAGFVGFSSIFTVHQAEQALVLQLGKVVRPESTPGIHFKVPFVQNVVYYDRRVLDYDNPPGEIPTLDQKQLVVDAFARYRIIDPLLFFQTATNELGMQARLSNIINTNLRNVLGGAPLSTIMTDERAQLMEIIAQRVDEQGKRFGINVLDVRIKRVDLPEENSQAIFRRMQTQREQEARKIRAEGGKEDKRIRAEADKEFRIVIAEGRKQSEIQRGEGDGKAQAIYNAAFGRDPKFFGFYESMKSYRQGLRSDSTRFIGPPSGEFYRYFGDMEGGGKKN